MLPIANMIIMVLNTELAIQPAPREKLEEIEELLSKDEAKRMSWRAKASIVLSHPQSIDYIKVISYPQNHPISHATALIVSDSSPLGSITSCGIYAFETIHTPRRSLPCKVFP